VDFKSEVVQRRQGGGSLREFAMLIERNFALVADLDDAPG
jgi:hypothetical protein